MFVIFMQLKAVKDEKEFLEIEVAGESHTLTQLVAKTAEGGDVAAVLEHPFMAEPKLIVSGTSPKKILEKAAAKIQKDAEEFRDGFKKAEKE